MSNEFDSALRVLGAQLLQRDWLSANHIVFPAVDGTPATVVDTGYARHASMTLALIDSALAGAPLERIVNTHLHSDHCGGNHALQGRYALQTLVPAASFETVQAWDESRLSYRPTGQLCERFRADAAIRPGDTLRLGEADWQVHAAPGHDPDAVLLFEPQTRTLISGDALWEDRLAIIFPELYGQDGFGQTRRTLELIETLAPRMVLPGHGAVFGDAAAALASSRRRLEAFEKDPARHAQHAARALVMFHMMEHQARGRDALEAWLLTTPIFGLSARVSHTPLTPARWASELVGRLVDDGWLRAEGEGLRLAAAG
ncbi:MAG TPA: MBL fold metallo-hydrolase [Ideonella sp.]|jgi:glyoxylase-like metal-dependent hydrolase (beta-lactamase superfamily II)|nr:MBL fold metallo-hydrolase [Ideonella sp.]